jgi:predicted nuclease with TOPRIM domain
MELSVALFVLLLVAAALVGAGLGTGVHRWRAGHERSADQQLAQKTAALKADLDEAIRASRRELQQREALRAELDEAHTDMAKTARRLAEVEEALQLAEDRRAVVEREAKTLRTQFRDVVGLESENTTLRALAARVPELEARLAASDIEPQVIDLREGSGRRRS